MPDNNRRNWVARTAIMRKGGVHDKTNKAKRQKEKQALKKKSEPSHSALFYGN